MKRTQSEQVGQVLRAFLRQYGLESPLNEHRILNAWNEVVGDVAARYTGEMFIKNQCLYVTIRSSIMRNELMMIRKSLVDKLNSKVGAQVITDIVFK